MANDANLIKEVMKLPENAICSDCDARDPDWVSINLGLFMCIKCSGVHRNLGVHISQVRSVDLDTCWTAELCAFMQSRGNVYCRKVYEQFAPMYYVRPFETESAIVRENWIRAKYVRKEFMADGKKGGNDVNPCIIKMPERVKEGWLMKANKKNVWQKRWFILIGRYLEYYKTPDSLTPKGSLDLSTVSLKVPDTNDAAHRFKWEVKSTKKEYPMCAEKEEEMFSWLHAIRRANVFYYTVGGDSQEKTIDPLPYSKIGKPYAAGYLQYPGGAFGTWVKKYCVIGPAANAIFMFKAKEQKQPMELELPETVVSLELSEVSDFSLKLNKKFVMGVVKPGRIHAWQASSQIELVEFMNACKLSMDTHTSKTEFDFQLNKPVEASASSGSSKPASNGASNSAAKPATSTAAAPASPTSAASASSSDSGSGTPKADNKSAPRASSPAVIPVTNASSGAGGSGSKPPSADKLANPRASAPAIPPKGSKAAPPIPSKGTKPAPAIPTKTATPAAAAAPAAATAAAEPEAAATPAAAAPDSASS